MRGGEHLADCEKETKEKPLWKRILEKHEGKMEGGKFEHFEMIQTTGGRWQRGKRCWPGRRIWHTLLPMCGAEVAQCGGASPPEWDIVLFNP